MIRYYAKEYGLPWMVEVFIGPWRLQASQHGLMLHVAAKLPPPTYATVFHLNRRGLEISGSSWRKSATLCACWDWLRWYFGISFDGDQLRLCTPWFAFHISCGGHQFVTNSYWWGYEFCWKRDPWRDAIEHWYRSVWRHSIRKTFHSYTRESVVRTGGLPL